MYRGNVQKVMEDAELIIETLRNTDTTLAQVKVEYRCAFVTLYKAIFSRISKKEYRKIAFTKTIKGGIATRFKKGHVPHNKYKKGIHYSQATEFKKGHLPVNHKNIGSITIRRDKCGKSFRFIKDRGIMQGKHHWEYYARWVWMQHKGEIPKGYCIVHLDGDTLNDDLSNLRCVDRKGHLQIQMLRDPQMVVKMRRNALKSNKKRHARNRLKKLRQSKKNKNLKIKKLKDFRKNPEKYWECVWCGHEFEKRPEGKCPTCQGIYFEKRQRIERYQGTASSF